MREMGKGVWETGEGQDRGRGVVPLEMVMVGSPGGIIVNYPYPYSVSHSPSFSYLGNLPILRNSHKAVYNNDLGTPMRSWKIYYVGYGVVGL